MCGYPIKKKMIWSHRPFNNSTFNLKNYKKLQTAPNDSIAHKL